MIALYSHVLGGVDFSKEMAGIALTRVVAAGNCQLVNARHYQLTSAGGRVLVLADNLMVDLPPSLCSLGNLDFLDVCRNRLV